VALGWQGTAMTIGSGAGAPLAGFAADHYGASGGYLAAGVAGVGLALLALGLTAAFGVGIRVDRAPGGPGGSGGPGGPGGSDESGGSGGSGDSSSDRPAPNRNTGARVAADTLTD
jgi:MFS family permease